MKTTKNIKTFLPLFPGFYGTLFEPDEDQVIEYPFTFDNYDFDYDSYYQDCAKACVNAIERGLKKLKLTCKIKFENVVSPREYNFANDSINVSFGINDDFEAKLKSYLLSHKEAFATYLERYKSCSGFISYYSNYVSDWLNYNIEDSAHYLGAMLDFVLTNEDFDLYEATEGSYYLFGELKKQSDFELNGIIFEGDRSDQESYFEWWYWNSEISFFEYCLANLKQIVIIDPNQLQFNF